MLITCTRFYSRSQNPFPASVSCVIMSLNNNGLIHQLFVSVSCKKKEEAFFPVGVGGTAFLT